MTRRLMTRRSATSCAKYLTHVAYGSVRSGCAVRLENHYEAYILLCFSPSRIPMPIGRIKTKTLRNRRLGIDQRKVRDDFRRFERHCDHRSLRRPQSAGSGAASVRFVMFARFVRNAVFPRRNARLACCGSDVIFGIVCALGSVMFLAKVITNIASVN